MNSKSVNREYRKNFGIKRYNLFVMLTIFASLLLFTYAYATESAIPAKLPDANTAGKADSFQPSDISHIENGIKTPEYAIIRANDETTFSSETTGKVIRLLVKEGSSFKKGDLLLQLDCRLQEADFKKARAQQTAANKALMSANKLKEYGSISEFELVKASTAAEEANAEAAKLAAIVEKCSIIAPFSGSVAKVKIHLYETAKPGDLLFQVTNTDDLYVEVQVPSNWLSWLHIGSAMRVHINDINKAIIANVNYINPAIDPISQTVKIVGQISSKIPNLRPGMTGEALFPDNPGYISRQAT